MPLVRLILDFILTYGMESIIVYTALLLKKRVIVCCPENQLPQLMSIVRYGYSFQCQLLSFIYPSIHTPFLKYLFLSSIHLFINWFIHLLIHVSVDWLIRPLIHWFIHWLIHPLIHWFIRYWSIHPWSIHPLIKPSIHPFIHPTISIKALL